MDRGRCHVRKWIEGAVVGVCFSRFSLLAVKSKLILDPPVIIFYWTGTEKLSSADVIQSRSINVRVNGTKNLYFISKLFLFLAFHEIKLKFSKRNRGFFC